MGGGRRPWSAAASRRARACGVIGLFSFLLLLQTIFTSAQFCQICEERRCGVRKRNARRRRRSERASQQRWGSGAHLRALLGIPSPAEQVIACVDVARHAHVVDDRVRKAVDRGGPVGEGRAAEADLQPGNRRRELRESWRAGREVEAGAGHRAVVVSVVRVRRRAGSVCLKPRIGHDTGSQASVSTRQAWVPCRACHPACAVRRRAGKAYKLKSIQVAVPWARTARTGEAARAPTRCRAASSPRAPSRAALRCPAPPGCTATHHPPTAAGRRSG